ncbi:MAG: VIT family protein [Thermoleophilia bacterium]|nr:VIT family protein [Thermoleophilia bacterium]
MASPPSSRTPEMHLVHRARWLRAAVLGANDGIVSTASLVLGVASAGGSRSAIVTAGVAGLVAGAMSMAAGEYVSVSSQRDVERADLERERQELADEPEAELAELAAIYRARGLSEELSWRVAEELTSGNALAVHARDELGIDTEELADPLQAAWASAVAFSIGAAVPLLTISLMPSSARVVAAIIITLVALAALGVAGAVMGGAPRVRAATRVVLWGALAMGITMAIGALVGTAVSL